MPDRNYDLAAELLASAIEESTADGGTARDGVVCKARARRKAAARGTGEAAGPQGLEITAG